jgi:hypothetical protein
MKTRHTITFAPQSIEIEVVVRGELGHYTRAISRATGLTESQVQYRLTKANVKRSDYRDGTSWIAKNAFKGMHDAVSEAASKDLYHRFVQEPKNGKR